MEQQEMPNLFKLMEVAQQQALKARKKAFRILIPAVILGSILLIVIGIIIGKYLL